MDIVADIVVGLVAALHLYFLVLEMFLWDTPTGHRTFGLEPAFAAESKTLAANQGLYNGFLAAGLVWGLVADREDVKLFFLACVIVAGAYGAVTVSRRILVVQALPALVGFVLVLAASADAVRRASSQPRNASRFAVDSPRRLRHSHSLRIEDAKPSSRIVLNDSSAVVSTAPSSRSSSSSSSTTESGSRPSR